MQCKRCGGELVETSTIRNKFSRTRCSQCKHVIRRNKRLPKPKETDLARWREMKASGKRVHAIAEAYKGFFHELQDARKFVDAL